MALKMVGWLAHINEPVSCVTVLVTGRIFQVRVVTGEMPDEAAA
jgi:hypothetical protein